MATQSKPTREVELKLAVPPGSAEALAYHAELRASQAQQRYEVSTYLDTLDLALDRRGFILRVRCANGHCVQTLKADGRNGVAADRAEWEWKLTSDKPDLGLLATTTLAGELPADLDVEPVFVTEIQRTIRTLRLDGGTIAEATLDKGTIVAGDRREPVSELELELRDGEPAALYRFAVKLHEDVPFTIESESKAARGYRLRRAEPPAAHKAATVSLPENIETAEAFRQIMTASLGHLLLNQPAGLGGDAEGVHQMRVAIRRLRAALMLFKPHLEEHATARFDALLRRFGKVFGEARDWDVFRLQILPEALDAADAAGWRVLLEDPAMARQEAAHQRFVQQLREPPFTGLVLGLAAWVEQGRTMSGLLGDKALQQPLALVCPPLLDRLAQKVERRGRHIDRSDADRHALRKSLKKLRYAIGYVQSLYPREPAKRYLRACKKLQQVLGDINDTVAATALADDLADATRPDLTPAIGALATSLDRRRVLALQDLPKRWKAFQGAEILVIVSETRRCRRRSSGCPGCEHFLDRGSRHRPDGELLTRQCDALKRIPESPSLDEDTRACAATLRAGVATWASRP